MEKRTPKVSVIIPVYNCEEYLQECLDSIFSQTFRDIEIIAVNDGSKDRSLEILRENEDRDIPLKVIDQLNHGQGYARNRALRMARGGYVLFVDADDRIEPLTIELAYSRALADGSDLVHFDWKLSSSDDARPDTYRYYNSEVFSHRDMLEGDDCDELMRLNNYFSVNNLYKKSFLDSNDIRYEEGHIYEDNTFMVEVANSATKISLLHSPLYIVRPNLTSSTRSNLDTDKHYRDFIRAVRLSFDRLNPRLSYTTFYLAAYFMEKFIVYYERRVPARYRSDYLRYFIDILADQDISNPNLPGKYRLLQLCLDKRVFKGRRYRLFHLLVLAKVSVIPRAKKAVGKVRRIKGKILNPKNNIYKNELSKPIIAGSVVFLGMDFRYALSSKYLFKEIISHPSYADKEVKFVTDDPDVPVGHRLEPGSLEAYRWLARSEVVIAETWVPNWMQKRHDGSVWIQLWHGTPIKRMLFDSHEPEITRKKRTHKNQKYRDILKWDFLVADSEVGAEKLSTAFLFPRERILQTGYPRVKFLMENATNNELKRSIKRRVGVEHSEGRKVVLYAPTWRDYNYGKSVSQSDYAYSLDVSELAERLGEEYIVMFHDHSYLSTHTHMSNERCIDVSRFDIQELLLITDHLVSDFSSVIFDAVPLDIPVSLFVTDFEKYEKSRGVYADIWRDLDKFRVDSIDSLSRRITEPDHDRSLSSRYTYRSDMDLAEFIADIDAEKLNRTW